MPDAIEVAQEYRRKLTKQENTIEAIVRRRYAALWDDIAADVEAAIATVIAYAGDDEVSPASVTRDAATLAIGERVTRGVGAIVQELGPRILQLQAVGAILGRDATLAMLGLSADSAIDTAALVGYVGLLPDGRTVQSLLGTLARGARVRTVLGIAAGFREGLDPSDIRQRARNGLGGSMARALTISRSEVSRAYRGGSMAQARESLGREPRAGWTWTAEIGADPPPCVVCLSMHGSWHTLEESLDSHANCRCVQAFGMEPPSDQKPQTGEEWFDEQPEDLQLAILGPSAHREWKAGKVALADFVMETDDPRWGRGLRRAPLAVATGEATA